MPPQIEIRSLDGELATALARYGKGEFPWFESATPELQRFTLLLAGAEEIEVAHRDRWGNWDGSFSERFYNGQLYSPQINQWLFEKAAYRPSWPDTKRYAIAITHDIDRMANQWTRKQSFRFLKRLATAIDRTKLSKKEQLQMLANGLFRQFGKASRYPQTVGIEKALALEAAANAQASYLFTVYPTSPIGVYDCAYQFNDPCSFESKKQVVSDLICEISRRGHDVGLHGSYFSAINPALLKSQREALEKILGKSVASTRQHYLQWDSWKTASTQESAGFKVDSTLGFNRTIGFRNGIALPFHPFAWDRMNASQVLEVPLVLQDGALFGNYGLELDSARAIAISKLLIDRVRDLGGCFSILLHPDQLEDKRVETWFKWILDYGNETQAWLTSLAEIEKWWSRKT